MFERACMSYSSHKIYALIVSDPKWKSESEIIYLRFIDARLLLELVGLKYIIFYFWRKTGNFKWKF